MLPAVKGKGSGRSSSASSLRSLQEEDDDLITDALKKSRAGLIYVKYFLGGANTKEFTLEGAIFKNIVDIFDLRKRLYNIKDIEQANFKTLLGNHMKEYSFGDKNDLFFHSNFDSGNLFSVVKGRDSVYYLEMTPDTNSTLDPGWFHFAVTNAKKGNRVVFRVINYTKPKFLNKAVCYRSKLDDSNPDSEWARLLEPDCSYYSNDEHLEVFDEVVLSRIKGKYTLEFIYQFEHDNDKVYFAPCPPYSYDDLQRDSLTWQLKCHNKRDYCFRKKLLCFTLTGRKLFYYEAYRAKEKTKTNMLKGQKIIILMARMHPSETASSFALQGFMEKLFDFEAGHKSEASFLRHHFMFVIIPMVNPDGVSVGNSCATFSGQSLKKTFAHPDRFIHPESFYIRKLIHTLSQSNQIMFYTDFRSSDYHKNCWIAGCEEKNFPGKKQREFPILMADWFKHFDLDKSK